MPKVRSGDVSHQEPFPWQRIFTVGEASFMGNSGDPEGLNLLKTSISSIVLHCIACLRKSSEGHTDVRRPHPNQVFVDRKLGIKRYSKTLNSARRVPRVLTGAYKLNLPSKALQVLIFASRSLQV